MKVNIIPFNDSQVRSDGIIKIDLLNLSLPSDFEIMEKMLITIPPKQCGGNHKHSRREIFICLQGDLEFHWVVDGHTLIRSMKEAGQMYLFDVPPHVPHAIINRSETTALILELADGKQQGLEPCLVVSNILSFSN